jgi:hypothetical protein
VEYYGISSRKAREALTVLKEEQIEDILEATRKGGKA